MVSFFEKLKKGMRVDIENEEVPEKTEEKIGPSGLKKSQKSPSKKKKVGKIKIETDLIEPQVEKEELKELKESIAVEKALEEEKEIKPEAKKPFFSKAAQKEEKLESKHGGFNLQNLGGEEGQLAVDVYQTDSELVIQSTIAGVKPEDLDISIEADTVLIRGNRAQSPAAEEKNYFYQECYWGPFSRQIILSEETDPSRAEATMKE